MDYSMDPHPEIPANLGPLEKSRSLLWPSISSLRVTMGGEGVERSKWGQGLTGRGCLGEAVEEGADSEGERGSMGWGHEWSHRQKGGTGEGLQAPRSITVAPGQGGRFLGLEAQPSSQPHHTPPQPGPRWG